MKIKYRTYIVLFTTVTIFFGCKKSFLEAKPSTTIVAPSTLGDLQGLMENNTILNFCTPALSLMASDDYIFIDYESWQSAATSTERNSYIWAKDLFGSDTKIADWRTGYAAIFYCNNVLETLKSIDNNSTNSAQYNFIKGWALYTRAYTLYDLVRNFSRVYDNTSSNTDLGLPIRLKPGIDEIVQRSSVRQTYDQILKDLEDAKQLLSPTIPINSNRPSKVAAYALFSRIYLSMNIYDKAEKYADSTLAINKKLIDYNTISKTSSRPFAFNNDESIFSTTSVGDAYQITYRNPVNTQVTVNPDLINLYAPNDLRLSVFFAKNPSTGNLYLRYGYYTSLTPYTGLATDEIYLIKAECLARRNEVDQGLMWLNSLLKMRYPTGTYVSYAGLGQQEALNLILTERRKELVWRTLRWSDLKRLNAKGANITLTRVLNGLTYTLPANDPRYVFPIPSDEISLSGISQNIR